MAEYIEREALMEQLGKKKAGIADKRYTEGFNDALMRFRSMVHSAKAADVVEVVRCKDCEFYDITEDGWYYCNLFGGLHQPDALDYCSLGERRNDAAD